VPFRAVTRFRLARAAFAVVLAAGVAAVAAVAGSAAAAPARPAASPRARPAASPRARPAPPPAVRYVALGDSYASGVGAGDYYGSSGSCERSPEAYPARWAAAHHPASYASAACAQATAGSVISGQLAALGPATTLVSITIGGNDAGFVPVMTTCVLLPTSICEAAVNAAEQEIRAVLPGRLDQVLAAISARVPRARVVVVGYPDPYDMSRSSSCPGLSTTDRTRLDQAADQLDGQLRAAAGRHGDVFADVRPAFAGHEICDPGRWLNAVDWPDLGASYHPTAAGQAAYARVLGAGAANG